MEQTFSIVFGRKIVVTQTIIEIAKWLAERGFSVEADYSNGEIRASRGVTITTGSPDEKPETGGK